MKTLLQRRKQVAQLPQVLDQYYAIKGGLDVTTPAFSRGPGSFDGVSNYELLVSGDRGLLSAERVPGYERYDGRTAPSQQTYLYLPFDSGSVEPSDDDVVTGASSSATGKVIEVVLSSGTWAGGDAAGAIILALWSGTFTDDETLNSDAPETNFATVDGIATENGEDDTTTHYVYLALAIGCQRDLVEKVPSTGTGTDEPVRGVQVYNQKMHAFRDTASIVFSSGSEEPSLDDVLEGQTSGATGTVAAVTVDSGTWGGGDAAGHIALSAVTGTWEAELVDIQGGTANVMNSDSATVSKGAMYESSSSGWVGKYAGLAADGTYEFVNYDFAAGQKMFGVNAVNKAFQWDGTTFTLLTSNQATDTPEHIAAHAKFLFVSYSSSVTHQDLGDPTAHTNTEEFNTSDQVSQMKAYNNQLIVLDRNRLWNLQGTGTATWVFTEISTTSGALPWTVQDMGRLRYLDDSGFTTVEATDAAGNFKHATFSQRIQPIIQNKLSKLSTVPITTSVAIKSRNVYRLFFGDNTAITFTVADKNRVVGFTQLEYEHSIECSTVGEGPNGNEVAFFGSDDGYVRQFDSGNTFDGESVVAWMLLSYWHYKSPRMKKRFKRIQVEMDAPRPVDIQFTSSYDYGDAAVQESDPLNLNILAGGGVWDTSDWDDFVWSSATSAQARGKVDGKGYNMGLIIYSESNEEQDEPGHKIQGVLTDYTMLARDRS